MYIYHTFIHCSVDRHIGRRKGWSSVQSNSVLCYVSVPSVRLQLRQHSLPGLSENSSLLKEIQCAGKCFWKNCELPRSRREAWKECGCIFQRVGSISTLTPAPRSPPEHLLSPSPPSRGREKGKLFPSQAQSHAIKDVAKMIHPLRILIPGWG